MKRVRFDGELLVRQRYNKGLTQAKLASEIGQLTASQISQYEAGRIVPVPETLRRLATYFNLAPSHFIRVDTDE